MPRWYRFGLCRVLINAFPMTLLHPKANALPRKVSKRWDGLGALKLINLKTIVCRFSVGWIDNVQNQKGG